MAQPSERITVPRALGAFLSSMLLCAVLLGASVIEPVQAAAPDCETMAAEAGRRAGLPDGLMPAIARIESGRTLAGQRRAWPWTLNHAGRGLYFDTRDEALAYLRKATRGGRTNIDVGCMQINHYWHGQAFETGQGGASPGGGPSSDAALMRMLDPATNLAYAVQFLSDLHARHGSWAEAVRRYHSPDAARGARYLASFSSARDRILRAPPRPRQGGTAANERADAGPYGSDSHNGAAMQGAAVAMNAPDEATAGPGAWPGLAGARALQPLGRAGMFGTQAPRGALLLAGDGTSVLPDPAETDALYAALVELAARRSPSILEPGAARPPANLPMAKVEARDLAWLRQSLGANASPGGREGRAR